MKEALQYQPKSILWLYPIVFSPMQDLFCTQIKKILETWHYTIQNIHKNSYWCLVRNSIYNWQQITFGTWYSIVGEQYLIQRWQYQWIYRQADEFPIWRAYYIDELYNKINTQLFVHTSSTDIQGKPIWVTANRDQINDMIKKLVFEF